MIALRVRKRIPRPLNSARPFGILGESRMIQTRHIFLLASLAIIGYLIIKYLPG